MSIDGVACALLSVSDTLLRCKTGPKQSASLTGGQPGSPGLTHTTKFSDQWNFDSAEIASQDVSATFEYYSRSADQMIT